MPNDVTCWDGGAAPLNKLQVALGNERSGALMRLTANEENVQPVNQAAVTMEPPTLPPFIIYFSKLMYFIIAG